MGELALWIAVLSLVLGVLALGLEIFLFPGFGAAGIAGLIMLAWGVVLLSTDVLQSVQSLVIGLVITLAFFAWAARLGYKRKLWHKLALNERQASDRGYSAARAELKELIGKKGLALTKLRPAGAADIDGKRVDVVTEGGYIAPGTEIIVTKVEGTRIVVKAVN